MKFQTQYPAGRAPLDLMGAADDPERLMRALESFIEYWFGPRRDDYGISLQRLKELELPMPLARLYAFAGQWPADNYFGKLFGSYDQLLPVELMHIIDDKLVFAWQTEGGCLWGVGLDGSDRRVWSRGKREGVVWERASDSLARFLVTFCLREACHESDFRGHGMSLSEVFRSRGEVVAPLWEDTSHEAGSAHCARRDRFNLAGGRILIWNDERCATNTHRVAEQYSDLLKAREPQSNWQQPVWEVDDAPPQVMEVLLKFFIRKQERLASEYEDRAAQHARLAEFFKAKLEALPDTESTN